MDLHYLSKQLNKNTSNKTKKITVLTTDNLYKILILNKYLINHTSESDVKSVRDILDYFEEKGIPISRASLYRNLAQLKKLTQCENYHKKNRIPYEISEDEFEQVEETGYFYNDDAKRDACDFQQKLPIPLTEKHKKALQNLQNFFEQNNKPELENDIQLLSEIINILSQ